MTLRVRIALLAAAPLLALSPSTEAASSFDSCTGFIAALPATLSTQGTWCLDKDLATALAAGNAIRVTTNNVTLDCNGFKLGGLAAGPDTTTIGVHAEDRTNITIRDCNIRGFAMGVSLVGDGGGHRVEGNRLDGNTVAGIVVSGEGSIVRDNQVRDTGGGTGGLTPWNFGIGALGHVDVLDNQIIGTDGMGSGTGAAVGIIASETAGNTIARNRIGATLSPGDNSVGLMVIDGGILDIRDNTFGSPDFGYSVTCEGDEQVLYGNGLLMGPADDCYDGGDNYGWIGTPSS